MVEMTRMITGGHQLFLLNLAGHTLSLAQPDLSPQGAYRLEIISARSALSERALIISSR